MLYQLYRQYSTKRDEWIHCKWWTRKNV